MPEPLSSGAAGAYAAAKSTWLLKLITIPAGIFGAVLLITIRPNMTRKQMAWHCVVASVFSVMGAGPVMQFLNGIGWIKLDAWHLSDIISLTALVALIIGALSWGFVGALYWFREKRAVSRAIDNLVGVTLKQKRHGNGYAYAATHTPDVSPVVAVKMTPMIVIV